MYNEDVIQEAVQVYEERMNDLMTENGDIGSVYELRRKHSTAKFEAVDHFIKNCRFEVNPWRLEKELREKFDRLVDTVKKHRKNRKNNMFSDNKSINNIWSSICHKPSEIANQQ